MRGLIQPRLESVERSALTQVDGAQHHCSCCWEAKPSLSARAAPACGLQEWGLAGATGEQEGNDSSLRAPLSPGLVGTKLPAGRQRVLSPLQLRPSSPRDSPHPHPRAQARQRHRGRPCTAPTHSSPARLQRGSQQRGACSIPHPKHHTLLPTGQTLCTSPETHTRLWGLCLNSLQMQKAQLDVFTHMAKEQLLTAAPAWPLFTPLFLPRQPASLLFLRSSFPRFCAALPRIPGTTQQPALLQSSPSLLLSHHFFGICCSQRSRNWNGEIPALGPSPLNSLWYWYRAHRRQYQAKGGSIHACSSPQLGAFYSITAIKNCPFKSFVSKISILATASADLLVGAIAGGIVNSVRVRVDAPAHRGRACTRNSAQPTLAMGLI